jgi:uncharacterized membrane protein
MRKSDSRLKPTVPAGVNPANALTGKSLEVLQEVQVSTSGPLPTPEALAAYDRTLQGAANRIVSMAENEQSHRHQQAMQAMQANINAQQRQLDLAERQIKSVTTSDLVGQILGAVISLAAVIGAAYLALNGQPYVAGCLVALPLAGIIRALKTRPQPNKASSSTPTAKT